VRLEPLAAGSRVLLRALHPLPAPWPEEILALGALAQGLIRPSRRRRAYEWASCQPTGGRDGAWRLARALLAQRGRFLAAATQVGVRHPDELRRRLILEGTEHLEGTTTRGGTLLLGFHLGSAVTALALRVAGYRVVLAGRGRGPLWPKAPARWIVPPQEDLIQWTDLMSCVTAMRRIGRRLRAGDTIYMAVDGDGREAFTIRLPGRDLVVRSGWLALRRSVRVRTLPVLAHAEGGRLRVRIHPPLPVPVTDLGADIASCREHLTPILEEFVTRFPEQCFMLALGRQDGRRSG
jgi:lauroyl/myristoyl acyltransferase